MTKYVDMTLIIVKEIDKEDIRKQKNMQGHIIAE